MIPAYSRRTFHRVMLGGDALSLSLVVIALALGNHHPLQVALWSFCLGVQSMRTATDIGRWRRDRRAR